MGKVKNHYHEEIRDLDDDFEDEAYREGQRAAIDGMDLPDGAYFAMLDEMGLDPF